MKVDLSGLVVQGVTFSQNVREAFGTVVEEKASDPPTYLVPAGDRPALTC